MLQMLMSNDGDLIFKGVNLDIEGLIGLEFLLDVEGYNMVFVQYLNTFWKSDSF